MKKKIEMIIECPSCKGTGLYSGMAESKEIAVICYNCKGTGAYEYKYFYNEFTGRKIKEEVKRVYKKGTRFKMGLGKINFDGIDVIDMDKEGVSYKEFLNGKIPEHIQKLECPLLADQGACHKIKGFMDRCNDFNNGWVGYIPDCKNTRNMAECWKIFNKGELK